jgi:hypothetical protein
MSLKGVLRRGVGRITHHQVAHGVEDVDAIERRRSSTQQSEQPRANGETNLAKVPESVRAVICACAASKEHQRPLAAQGVGVDGRSARRAQVQVRGQRHRGLNQLTSVDEHPDVRSLQPQGRNDTEAVATTLVAVLDIDLIAQLKFPTCDELPILIQKKDLAQSLAVMRRASQTRAQDARDAAAQAKNPLANMTALNFQDYCIDRITDTGEDGNQFWLRFAKPFEVVGTSWLMRTSLPVSTFPVGPEALRRRASTT